jgi:hypothetical protein
VFLGRRGADGVLAHAGRRDSRKNGGNGRKDDHNDDDKEYKEDEKYDDNENDDDEDCDDKDENTGTKKHTPPKGY